MQAGHIFRVPNRNDFKKTQNFQKIFFLKKTQNSKKKEEKKTPTNQLSPHAPLLRTKVHFL